MAVTTAPTYTEIVPQKTIIEPLEGPKFPGTYLDRFPDKVYNKAPDTRLVKLLYSLLGSYGVGAMRLQSFKNRLALEAHGIELFDLDQFYGNPFAFGRILNELHDEDVFGVLSREEWDAIKVKDERYRSRALDFMKGVKAGNTPLGIRFVARSGLGHEVEVVENYKYLFDQHSDDPIGVNYYGSTFSLQEFIILPRQETPRNEVQTISIVGTATGGTFKLSFNGQTTGSIPYDATYDEVENALRSLSNIGSDGVKVRSIEDGVFSVTFTGHLSKTNVSSFTALDSIIGATIEIESADGVSDEDEIVYLTNEDQHNLQTALDRTRPVNTIFTVAPSSGNARELTWAGATASSEYNEVIRYVTGQPKVDWKTDNYHWIEKDIEKEAHKVYDYDQYHYYGFHNVNSITASSEYVGQFVPAQKKIFPYLSNNDPDLVYKADRVLADYAEPISVKAVTTPSLPIKARPQPSTNLGYINGIYPIDYLFYPNIPGIKYKDEQFWASGDGLDGSETLIIDLGQTVAVNFLQMEVSKKPVDITIEYDALGQPDEQNYVEVTPKKSDGFTHSVEYEGSISPWLSCDWHFDNGLGQMIYTQYIKITFTRSGEIPTIPGTPWTIEAKNLRVGRNVSDF